MWAHPHPNTCCSTPRLSASDRSAQARRFRAHICTGELSLCTAGAVLLAAISIGTWSSALQADGSLTAVLREGIN